MKTLETTIPLSGFYNSIHDQETDNYLQYSVSCDGQETSENMLQLLHNSINWKDLRSEYAQEYTECFAREFDLPSIKYKLLSSPKYYNFETDRIVAEISLNDIKKIFNIVPIEDLKQGIKDRFTSYDGFISFYSNDLNQWPLDLELWDLNQIGTLLEIYINLESKFDQFKEYELLDPIHETLSPLFDKHCASIDRVYKITNYLEVRSNRKQ